MYNDKGKGRLIPTDWVHIERYSLMLPTVVETVERIFPISYAYRIKYDQGREGACVGFASSWMQSILNRLFYDARWLYLEAQLVDSWSETPPEEGTSVRAGMDILRKIGHRQIYRGISRPASLNHGILSNHWARSVDEMRTCISQGKPVTIGVNWYENFDNPVQKGYNNHWIGEGYLGRVLGGHAICVYGASDKRQAFKLVNSWGKGYPLVWVPYETMQRLLNEYGEATVITDAP